MDEDDPKQVCYTLYTHPREWPGIKHAFGDEVRLVAWTDVPRNGEPAAPMTHALVLPEHVADAVITAQWYLGCEHSHPHWASEAGLTEVQWAAMLAFCRLFLAAYEHLGGKE